jgi:hypothetical protein
MPNDRYLGLTSDDCTSWSAILADAHSCPSPCQGLKTVYTLKTAPTGFYRKPQKQENRSVFGTKFKFVKRKPKTE